MAFLFIIVKYRYIMACCGFFFSFAVGFTHLSKHLIVSMLNKTYILMSESLSTKVRITSSSFHREVLSCKRASMGGNADTIRFTVG